MVDIVRASHAKFAWLARLYEWVKSLWGRKSAPQPVTPVRKIVNTSDIRARIAGLGWQLREIPIKRNHPDSNQRTIMMWKLIAMRNEKSVEVSSPTLDQAMKLIGTSLGVIPKGS